MSDIFTKIKQDPHYSSKNSSAWFQQRIRQLISGSTQLTSAQMVKEQKALLTTQLLPGRMYAFAYDPKHKDTLPYYDRFPLILPFSKAHNSFTGLNLHYLSPALRIVLLNKLQAFAKLNRKGDAEYLRFSWSMIGAASKYREVAPCVKMYLNSHVQTKFIEIPPADWMLASQLPMSNFAKAKPVDVWKESNRMIRGKR